MVIVPGTFVFRRSFDFVRRTTGGGGIGARVVCGSDRPVRFPLRARGRNHRRQVRCFHHWLRVSAELTIVVVRACKQRDFQSHVHRCRFDPLLQDGRDPIGAPDCLTRKYLPLRRRKCPKGSSLPDVSSCPVISYTAALLILIWVLLETSCVPGEWHDHLNIAHRFPAGTMMTPVKLYPRRLKTTRKHRKDILDPVPRSLLIGVRRIPIFRRICIIWYKPLVLMFW